MIRVTLTLAAATLIVAGVVHVGDDPPATPSDTLASERVRAHRERPARSARDGLDATAAYEQTRPTPTPTPTPVPTATATTVVPAPPPPPAGDVWWRLALCESGGRNITNPSGKYRGYLQFDLRTWRSVGMTGDPLDHTWEQQLAAAKRLHARRGFSPWPQCAARLGLRR